MKNQLEIIPQGLFPHASVPSAPPLTHQCEAEDNMLTYASLQQLSTLGETLKKFQTFSYTLTNTVIHKLLTIQESLCNVTIGEYYVTDCMVGAVTCHTLKAVYSLRYTTYNKLGTDEKLPATFLFKEYL